MAFNVNYLYSQVILGCPIELEFVLFSVLATFSYKMHVDLLSSTKFPF